MQENPLLFHDGNAWVKKEGNPSFDVTMRSYRGYNKNIRTTSLLFVTYCKHISHLILVLLLFTLNK